MSDTPSLGWRWIAACHRAGVEPWAAGMLALPTANAADDPPARVLAPVEGVVAWFDGSANDGDLNPADVPDLTDPATIGAAIGVLREWSGESTLHTLPICHSDWTVERVRDDGVAEWLRVCGQWGEGKTDPVHGATEAEAIAAAAEALAAGGGR